MKVYFCPMIGHGGLAAKENCLFMAPRLLKNLSATFLTIKKCLGLLNPDFWGGISWSIYISTYSCWTIDFSKVTWWKGVPNHWKQLLLWAPRNQKKKNVIFLTLSNLLRGGEKSLNASVLWRSSGHFLTTPENSFGRNGHRKKHCPWFHVVSRVSPQVLCALNQKQNQRLSLD